MDHFLDDATSLDPAFPSRIEGASPDEVDRVQAAANVPLPADYRKYLDLMGRNDAGMITAPEELSTSASEIAAFYETDREQDEYVVPASSGRTAARGRASGSGRRGRWR